MSRKLKRSRATARRTLRIESLEMRTMMHGEAVLEAADTRVAEPPDQPAAVESYLSPLSFDANRDGRLDLGELRNWLGRWKQRRDALDQPPPGKSEPEKPAPGKPDVLPDVADYGGATDWHLNAINAPEAWAAGHRGQGVTVAVIDTGADLRHREIRNGLWTNPGEIPGNGRDDDGNGYVDDVHGWDFVHNDRTPQDRNGHGTHVSSLIVGARDGVGPTGVAYGAELMVLQGLGADGVGDTRNIARAVRYAVDEGADIINLSLSGARSTALESAIEYARVHGVLIVAAAGNQSAASPGAPASLSEALSNVISVGASTNRNALASFSNRAGPAKQVVAPGVRLLAAVPGGLAYHSGTSMAAPLVAGVAALALSAAPELVAGELRQLLTAGASSSIAGDDSHGLVNAAATVAQAAKSVADPRTAVSVSTVASGFETSSSVAASASQRWVAAASELLRGNIDTSRLNRPGHVARQRPRASGGDSSPSATAASERFPTGVLVHSFLRGVDQLHAKRRRLEPPGDSVEPRPEDVDACILAGWSSAEAA